jgi:hypothetical protein
MTTGTAEIMYDTPIGSFIFVDGEARTVFLDQHGRQYACNDYGMPVFGVWLFLDDSDLAARENAHGTEESRRI